MKEVISIANGDLRLSANQMCQEAQAAMEKQVVAAVQKEGATVKRGHPYDPVKKHGFIDSQKYGMEVFRTIDPEAPLIVAEAVWQYSHHVLAGLITHKGPILTRRQLERDVARPGRDAQPQRLAHQGGRHVQHALERGLHGRLLHARPARVAARRQACATTRATSAPTTRPRRPPEAVAAGPEVRRRRCSATRPSWASSTRAAWACTTPSSPTTCCTRPASTKSA